MANVIEILDTSPKFFKGFNMGIIFDALAGTETDIGDLATPKWVGQIFKGSTSWIGEAPEMTSHKDENGNVWGAVFVSTSKEFGKRDIILMDERTGTHSARSITELINMLSKKNVSFTDKKRVLEFLAERLRILEQDTKLYNFNTPVTKKTSKKDKK